MVTEMPPSVDGVRTRATTAATQQEQVITTSAQPDLWVLNVRTRTVTPMFSRNASIVSPEIERDFYRLAQQWREQTAHLSLANEKANNILYHQIIGMGKEVLPLIFRELETTTSDWFWALAAIARDNAPVIPPEDRGRGQRIARIWIEWGRQHGYVSG